MHREGQKWTAVAFYPAGNRKQAVREMNELKLEAEATHGVRIWTDPPTHDGQCWRLTGIARRNEKGQ